MINQVESIFQKINITTFLFENEKYLTKHNFYNDDETINCDKLRMRLNQSISIVTSLSPCKDLHIISKNIKTDLYELLL